MLVFCHGSLELDNVETRENYPVANWFLCPWHWWLIKMESGRAIRRGRVNQHDVCLQIWCMCWLSPDAKKNVSMTNAEVGIFSPPSSFCRYRVIRYWFSLPIINLAVAVDADDFSIQNSLRQTYRVPWLILVQRWHYYLQPVIHHVGVVFVDLIFISPTRGATAADTTHARVKG